MIYQGGYLYGTTGSGGINDGTCDPYCGTVFKVDVSTGAETVLHSFPSKLSDGAYPVAGLLYQGGNLFGTTNTGGSANAGTVFKLNATTGDEKVLYSFKGGTDGYQPAAGMISEGKFLYGTTYMGGATGGGTVFKVDSTTGSETVLYSFLGGSDGCWPKAALLYEGGDLYGTTGGGRLR